MLEYNFLIGVCILLAILTTIIYLGLFISQFVEHKSVLFQKYTIFISTANHNAAMKKYLLLSTLYLLIFTNLLKSQPITFKYQNNETFTVDEATKAYKTLEDAYPKLCKLQEVGMSDIGRPIHLFIISEDGNFDPAIARQKGKLVLFVNNGIHAGEPPGVDASVKFAQQLLTLSEYKKKLKNVVVCIIPFYNVDGGLNRSCCSRANQNGPTEYGFRGNAQNRDLNRDFIKTDTRNTEAFVNAYQAWLPDVFIDTHDTNGSDFQYVMTLITSQLDKQNRYLAEYQRKSYLPKLYADMKDRKFEMIPYVNFRGQTPESGLIDFLETPRYSTGYSTLFGSLGFVTETLKYKSFPERVEATYQFLLSTLSLMVSEKNAIVTAREKALDDIKNIRIFALNWELDTTNVEQIEFKGYETKFEKSTFGKDTEHMIYDHSRPYTKKIPYYNRYKPTVTIQKPSSYIIPQSWHDVVERLMMNKIILSRLEKDTTIAVEMYFIESFETVKNPYEGHYLHYNVKVRKEYMPIKFYKGDYVAETNQAGNRYLIETLEPQGNDSFFAWNFFDGILQQKEWFSSFSFEPLAKELLKNDQYIRNAFERKKKEDPELAKDHWEQLYFIYKLSPYYENTHNRYPVGRIP